MRGNSRFLEQKRRRLRHALLDHQEVISVLQLRQIRRQDGQTMAEYGVVLAVITALVFGALTLLSGNIVSALTRVAGLVGVGNG
jgi:Flp pilus assembly pilin Flp